jgi:rare lipoprotein A
MGERTETSNRNILPRLGLSMVAVSACISAGLYAPLVLNVQADAPLSRPPSTLPPAAPLAIMTDAEFAPAKVRPDMLHGVASWYGSVLNGHRTASGERFDMYALTACHPTLPFGTLVRVVDLKTDRSVVVRINDRGILDEGRIIDLSYAAAQELKIVKPGLAEVKLEVISLGKQKHKKG